MKEEKTKYEIINVFANSDISTRKRKINDTIIRLSIMDIERKNLSKYNNVSEKSCSQKYSVDFENVR